ncbi:MAG: hypothetical protein ABJF01_07525 [bacterium]
MTANMKSMVLLAITLVAGFALGLFVDASLVRRRREQVGELRRPPGFAAHMEGVIAPRNDAQRDSIRPVLERFGQGNIQIIREANAHLHTAFDSMRTTLAPMLDQEQRDRLSREIDRIPNPFRPGGRGRGGPPGRPGGRGGQRPDDRGPPPGGGPPPVD